MFGREGWGIMSVDCSSPPAPPPVPPPVPVSQTPLVVRGHGAAGPAAGARVAKRASARCGAALYGVLGFAPARGVVAGLLGGVAWLIAADHAGYALRRRWGPRVVARLPASPATAAPATAVTARLTVLLKALISPPEVGYRVFVLSSTGGAVVWAAAFVGVGYLGAAGWQGAAAGRQPMVLAGVAVTVAGLITVAGAARHTRRVSRLLPAGAHSVGRGAR